MEKHSSHHPQAALLHKYLVTFQNVESNPKIRAAMTQYGYNQVVIAEGKGKLIAAQISSDQEDLENENDSVNHIYDDVWLNRKKKKNKNKEPEKQLINKHAAIDEIRDWMIDFYRVAEVALENKPQLLEAVGRFVR